MDRLSNLPDAIRNQVVTFLPTKDALRTSVLSSQWRYISSSLPTLEFTLKSEILNSNFRDCVYKTLSSHDETDLESLVLKFSLDAKYVTFADVSCWVNFALKNKIQRFNLDVNYFEELLDLPCSFFQCESLQFLRFGKFTLPMPTRIRFSNLRTLVLESIHFPAEPDDIDLVNKVLNQTTLPVLEALEIRGCSQFDTLCISIPSLIKLKLYSYYQHQRVFVSVPSLQDIFYFGCPLEVCPKTLASLNKGLFEFPHYVGPNTDASDIPSADANDNPNTDASDILFGLSNIETLCLRAPFIESLSADKDFFGKSPILSAKLKHLYIHMYRTKKHFQVASFLLKCFPNLQAITIYYSVVLPEKKLAEDEFVVASDFCFEGASKLPTLEIIKVYTFGGTEPERDLMIYLLQRASDLTKVNVTYIPGLKEPQITDIEKLLTLPRGSE